ncbi:MAG: universal stress protein [Labilithrix sp.]|nr:universal stress protein [Labilithrix sp.]
MRFYRTILVPTDFGASSQAALDYAVELARPFGGEVVLLHAYALPVMGLANGPLITAELTKRILDSSQACLDEAIAAHRGCGVALRAFLREGDPWLVTIDVIKEVSADLVVMGTHGRRGLPRFLIGSVAERLVRTSPVPVLTVHATGRHEEMRLSGGTEAVAR